MTKHPGLGVMLAFLAGNEASVKAYNAALGKKIAAAELGPDTLDLYFEDGSGIRFHDEGQSCCESRYMRTDDEISWLVGKKFKGAEIKDAPGESRDCGEHEIQFLEIQTPRGVVTISNHNEHNGYYGGFALRVSEVSR